MAKSQDSKRTRSKGSKPRHPPPATQDTAPTTTSPVALVTDTEVVPNKWRQPSASNKYNPAGLSLAAINMEISGAFGQQDDIQRLMTHHVTETLQNMRARQARENKSAGQSLYEIKNDKGQTDSSN